VVPAREGLRLRFFTFIIEHIEYRRSGSSKRRIKTPRKKLYQPHFDIIGEVVPAREGLRLIAPNNRREIHVLVIGEVVPAREGLRPFR